MVISDNASTDDTKEICRYYCDKYENFYYFCNETNVMDQNFPLALSRAHGKIRKLNNDTFVLYENSLNFLCEEIKKAGEERFIYFINENSSLPYDQEYEEFIKNISFKLSWIASFLFWEKDCEGIAQKVDGCELKLWQIKRILEFASQYKSIRVIQKNIGKSIVPDKKDLSYGIYTVFHDNLLSIIEEFENKGVIHRDTVEQIEKDLLFNFFHPWLINYKLYKNKYKFSSKENMEMRIKKAYQDKPYWKSFKKQFRWDYLKSMVKKLLRRT